MSKLDNLIAELCPNGVEYRTLSSIAMYSDTRINAADVDTNNYVGVDNLLQDKQGKTISSYVPVEGRLTQFSNGDILIGNIRPYLKKIWLSTQDGGTNGDVLAVRIKNVTKIMPEFLFYILSSEQFFKYDVQHSKGAKMPRGDKSAIMDYIIPLPPLPIQREIVQILDNFTELTAELTAELIARKSQYEYYRNELLVFDDSVKFIKLGDKVSVGVGANPKALNGKYDFINAGTSPSGSTNDFNTEGDTITTPSRGQGGIGFVGYQSRKFWCGPLCYRIRSNDSKLITKYLYYVLANSMQGIVGLAHMTGVPALNRKELIEFLIPFPPLSEQARIVAILDRFDTLTSDITSGLPAEIEARRKQYEYYRDKLLSFKDGE